MSEKEANRYHADQPYVITIEDKLTEYYCFRYQKMDYPVEDTYEYAKGDVHIILEYEQEKISRIVVSLYADTENNLGIKI